MRPAGVLKLTSALTAAGAIAGGPAAGRSAAAAPPQPAAAKSAASAELAGCPAGYPENLPAAEVKRRFLQLLGEFVQPSVPLAPAVTEEIELPGRVVRQRVEYDVRPANACPPTICFAAICRADALGLLSIHAHGGSTIFPVGKAYHCHPQADDPGQYSYRAALDGFRVLAPDALLFGERQTRRGETSSTKSWPMPSSCAGFLAGVEIGVG